MALSCKVDFDLPIEGIVQLLDVALSFQVDGIPPINLHEQLYLPAGV